MNDMQALTDAFAELERRADNAPPRSEARRSRGPRLVPVAAAVVVAGGLVTGITLLSPDDAAPAQVPVGVSPHSTTTLPIKHSPIPSSAKQLEDRFREVLGDRATFEVTDHAGSGAAIVGVLTAGGHRGGFDLQIMKTEPGRGAMCADLDQSSCSIKRLSDGSSLAVGTEPVLGNGITHQVDLVRKDGTEFLMHVSNERDPKGDSEVLSPKPPLTTDQMVAILASAKW